MKEPLDVPAALHAEPEVSIKPLREALLLSGIYCAVALAWILASTEMAAKSAATVAELRRWEWLKGSLFVVTTTVLVFVVVLLLLRRIRRQQEIIVSQLHALVRAESAVVSGIVASTVSHDLNNALQVAMASAEMMREALSAPQREQDQLEQSLELVASLTRRLGQAGEALGGAAAPFDVVATLGSVIENTRRHPHLAGCTVEFQPGVGASLQGVRQLVTRAMLNLILNAAEAAGDNARVVVRTSVEDGALVISVEDDGPGVPAEVRDRIFHPFFSTKEGGHGLGLLSVVACVERHGGHARVGESPLGGARFDMILPGAETEVGTIDASRSA